MTSEDSPLSPDQTSTPQLETVEVADGLVLRPITVEDSEEMFALIDSSREHLSQYGDDTAAKYPTLQSVIDRNSTQSPQEKRFGIRDQDKMVGFVKVTNRGSRGWEIGYWTGAKFIGRGYMTKAADALTEYAFEKLGAQRVFAEIHRKNKPSQRVVEKIGFTFEGRRKGAINDHVFARYKPQMLSEG